METNSDTAKLDALNTATFALTKQIVDKHAPLADLRARAGMAIPMDLFYAIVQEACALGHAAGYERGYEQGGHDAD